MSPASAREDTPANRTALLAQMLHMERAFRHLPAERRPTAFFLVRRDGRVGFAREADAEQAEEILASWQPERLVTVHDTTMSPA